MRMNRRTTPPVTAGYSPQAVVALIFPPYTVLKPSRQGILSLHQPFRCLLSVVSQYRVITSRWDPAFPFLPCFGARRVSTPLEHARTMDSPGPVPAVLA
jgi:hypothetical protein